jgi:hypothetical protein
MTEREIELLGMRKENINEYEGDDSYYYVLDLVNGLTFITECNTQVENNDWNVDVFNTEPTIRFTNFAEVQGLLNKLSNAIVSNG